MRQRSIREDHVHPQHMRSREAVFQTVRAARVFRHVATDATHRLRRRIGGIKVSIGRNAGGYIQIDDARLDHHALIRQVHLKDAIHLRQTDNNTASNRQRALLRSGSRSARHKWNALPMTDPQHALHLLGRSR